MAGRQAKTLSINDIGDLLVFASVTRYPVRNRALVLLSVKAGLRAGEMANLTWDMVLDGAGTVGWVIELRDHAAKKSRGRRIPLHPELRAALIDLRFRNDGSGPVPSAQNAARGLRLLRWSSGFPKPTEQSDCKVARPILAAARSSPEPPGWSTRPVVRCAMSNCWLVTGRSRPPSGTSMAIPMPSASSYR